MKVIVYAPDLMDRSRFGVIKDQAEVTFAKTPDELIEVQADVAVGDLGRDGVTDALASASAARKVGFISHIDSAGRAQAQQVKIEVYARSKFFSRLVAVLTQGGQSTADTDD